MNHKLILRRADLIREMTNLGTMKTGNLNAEYCQNPSGQPTRTYCQYQVWEHGANTNRSIPADEVPSLWHFADECLERPLLETDRADSGRHAPLQPTSEVLKYWLRVRLSNRPERTESVESPG